MLQQNWLNRADWLLLCLLEKREVSLQMRTECVKSPLLSRNRTEGFPWSQDRFMQKPFFKNAPSPSLCQLQKSGTKVLMIIQQVRDMQPNTALINHESGNTKPAILNKLNRENLQVCKKPRLLQNWLKSINIKGRKNTASVHEVWAAIRYLPQTQNCQTVQSCCRLVAERQQLLLLRDLRASGSSDSSDPATCTELKPSEEAGRKTR